MDFAQTALRLYEQGHPQFENSGSLNDFKYDVEQLMQKEVLPSATEAQILEAANRIKNAFDKERARQGLDFASKWDAANADTRATFLRTAKFTYTEPLVGLSFASLPKTVKEALAAKFSVEDAKTWWAELQSPDARRAVLGVAISWDVMTDEQREKVIAAYKKTNPVADTFSVTTTSAKFAHWGQLPTSDPVSIKRAIKKAIRETGGDLEDEEDLKEAIDIASEELHTSSAVIRAVWEGKYTAKFASEELNRMWAQAQQEERVRLLDRAGLPLKYNDWELHEVPEPDRSEIVKRMRAFGWEAYAAKFAVFKMKRKDWDYAVSIESDSPENAAAKAAQTHGGNVDDYQSVGQLSSAETQEYKQRGFAAKYDATPVTERIKLFGKLGYPTHMARAFAARKFEALSEDVKKELAADDLGDPGDIWASMSVNDRDTVLKQAGVMSAVGVATSWDKIPPEDQQRIAKLIIPDGVGFSATFSGLNEPTAKRVWARLDGSTKEYVLERAGVQDYMDESHTYPWDEFHPTDKNKLQHALEDLNLYSAKFSTKFISAESDAKAKNKWNNATPEQRMDWARGFATPSDYATVRWEDIPSGVRGQLAPALGFAAKFVGEFSDISPEDAAHAWQGLHPTKRADLLQKVCGLLPDVAKNLSSSEMNVLPNGIQQQIAAFFKKQGGSFWFSSSAKKFSNMVPNPNPEGRAEQVTEETAQAYLREHGGGSQGDKNVARQEQEGPSAIADIKGAWGEMTPGFKQGFARQALGLSDRAAAQLSTLKAEDIPPGIAIKLREAMKQRGFKANARFAVTAHIAEVWRHLDPEQKAALYKKAGFNESSDLPWQDLALTVKEKLVQAWEGQNGWEGFNVSAGLATARGLKAGAKASDIGKYFDMVYSDLINDPNLEEEQAWEQAAQVTAKHFGISVAQAKDAHENHFNAAGKKQRGLKAGAMTHWDKATPDARAAWMKKVGFKEQDIAAAQDGPWEALPHELRVVLRDLVAADEAKQQRGEFSAKFASMTRAPQGFLVRADIGRNDDAFVAASILGTQVSMHPMGPVVQKSFDTQEEAEAALERLKRAGFSAKFNNVEAAAEDWANMKKAARVHWLTRELKVSPDEAETLATQAWNDLPEEVRAAAAVNMKVWLGAKFNAASTHWDEMSTDQKQSDAQALGWDEAAAAKPWAELTPEQQQAYETHYESENKFDASDQVFDQARAGGATEDEAQRAAEAVMKVERDANPERFAGAKFGTIPWDQVLPELAKFWRKEGLDGRASLLDDAGLANDPKYETYAKEADWEHLPQYVQTALLDKAIEIRDFYSAGGSAKFGIKRTEKNNPVTGKDAEWELKPGPDGKLWWFVDGEQHAGPYETEAAGLKDFVQTSAGFSAKFRSYGSPDALIADIEDWINGEPWWEDAKRAIKEGGSTTTKEAIMDARYAGQKAADGVAWALKMAETGGDAPGGFKAQTIKYLTALKDAGAEPKLIVEVGERLGTNLHDRITESKFRAAVKGTKYASITLPFIPKAPAPATAKYSSSLTKEKLAVKFTSQRIRSLLNLINRMPAEEFDKITGGRQAHSEEDMRHILNTLHKAGKISGVQSTDAAELFALMHEDFDAHRDAQGVFSAKFSASDIVQQIEEWIEAERWWPEAKRVLLEGNISDERSAVHAVKSLVGAEAARGVKWAFDMVIANSGKDLPPGFAATYHTDKGKETVKFKTAEEAVKFLADNKLTKNPGKVLHRLQQTGKWSSVGASVEKLAVKFTSQRIRSLLNLINRMPAEEFDKITGGRQAHSEEDMRHILNTLHKAGKISGVQSTDAAELFALMHEDFDAHRDAQGVFSAKFSAKFAETWPGGYPKDTLSDWDEKSSAKEWNSYAPEKRARILADVMIHATKSERAKYVDVAWGMLPRDLQKTIMMTDYSNFKASKKFGSDLSGLTPHAIARKMLEFDPNTQLSEEAVKAYLKQKDDPDASWTNSILVRAVLEQLRKLDA